VSQSPATCSKNALTSATSMGSRYDAFLAGLFAELPTTQLEEFVFGLSRVVARLRAAVPTRAGDTGPS
jgi:hypothetical protein